MADDGLQRLVVAVGQADVDLVDSRSLQIVVGLVVGAEERYIGQFIAILRTVAEQSANAITRPWIVHILNYLLHIAVISDEHHIRRIATLGPVVGQHLPRRQSFDKSKNPEEGGNSHRTERPRREVVDIAEEGREEDGIDNSRIGCVLDDLIGGIHPLVERQLHQTDSTAISHIGHHPLCDELTHRVIAYGKPPQQMETEDRQVER